MKTLLRPAITLFILLSIVTGLIYPWLVTGIGQALFPTQTMGSLIERDGRRVGAYLIGQHFTAPEYFWGRPSATLLRPYNAAASAGSNMGPLNPALMTAISSRIEALRKADPDNIQSVPVDLVTASASGLDPHISPAAADYQVTRIALARGLPHEILRDLIRQYTEDRQWGLLGEPRVNVLALNLALDRIDLGPSR